MSILPFKNSLLNKSLLICIVKTSILNIMKGKHMIKIHYLLRLSCLFLFFTAGLSAQDQSVVFEVPTTNSHAIIKQRVAATDIEVSYNRPCVKGRTIFGALVPWDQVWRTGSDASTKISFSTAVSINGTAIEAGSYEFFSIPGKTEWIIIIQKNHSQWGSQDR